VDLGPDNKPPVAINAPGAWEPPDVGTPIRWVPPDEVAEVWAQVGPMIARAILTRSGYTLNAVLRELLAGRTQLWVIGDFDGAVVTMVQNRPAQRVLWVLFMAGDGMDEWLDDWLQVQEKYALYAQCKAIEFSGRKGWHKVAASRARYKPIMTLFRMEIEP